MKPVRMHFWTSPSAVFNSAVNWWPGQLRLCSIPLFGQATLAHREVFAANISLERILSLAQVLTTPNTELQPARFPRAAVGVDAAIQRHRDSMYRVLHVHDSISSVAEKVEI